MFGQEPNDLQVLQHKGIPGHLKSTAFGVLRKLCGTFQQLPSSCFIGQELRIDDGLPFATRAYADLRKGTWKGERVAIKLLRFSADENKTEITKVQSSLRDTQPLLTRVLPWPEVL